MWKVLEHNIKYSEMQSGLDSTQLFDLMVALIGSKQKTDETKRQKRGEAEVEGDERKEKTVSVKRKRIKSNSAKEVPLKLCVEMEQRKKRKTCLIGRLVDTLHYTTLHYIQQVIISATSHSSYIPLPAQSPRHRLPYRRPLRNTDPCTLAVWQSD